jgi:hypothetical protein
LFFEDFRPIERRAFCDLFANRRTTLMKRTYLFGTMMAFGLATAASVGAQQDRPTPSASDQAGKNVVVTGCLKSGTSVASGAATGTAGTTGTSGTTGSATSSAAGTATGTAGSTAAPSGSTAPDAKDKAKSFALVGGQASELQGYVNSKVEISGTIDPSASATTGSSTASGTPATGTGSTASGSASSMPGMSHASDQPQQLRVTAVRQVAGSCDAGQQ